MIVVQGGELIDEGLDRAIDGRALFAQFVVEALAGAAQKASGHAALELKLMHQPAGLLGHGGQRLQALHFADELLAFDDAGHGKVEHGQGGQAQCQQELATDTDTMQ